MEYLPGIDHLTVWEAAVIMSYSRMEGEPFGVSFDMGINRGEVEKKQIEQNIHQIGKSVEKGEIELTDPYNLFVDEENTGKTSLFEEQLIRIEDFRWWVQKYHIRLEDQLDCELTLRADKIEDNSKINSIHHRELTSEEFSELEKAPLWTLETGLLYCYGFKGYDNHLDLACLNKLENFKPLQPNKLSTIYKYIIDAFKLNEIMLINNNYEEKRFEYVWYQIRPKDLISWLDTQGFDFPMRSVTRHIGTSDTIKEKPLTTKEENSMKRLIYGLFQSCYRWDGQSPLEPLLRQASGDMSEFGGMNEDTIRKYVKAGQELTEE